MSFNIILTFRVNCRNSLWNLVVILNFRGGSTFYFRPILHSFPRELKSLQRTKTILRDRVPFYQEKEAVFEVILSTCSEFSQIGTPHFSLEGVVCDLLVHQNLYENAFAAFLLSEIGYDSPWIRARRWSILSVFRAWDGRRKE